MESVTWGKNPARSYPRSLWTMYMMVSCSQIFKWELVSSIPFLKLTIKDNSLKDTLSYSVHVSSSSLAGIFQSWLQMLTCNISNPLHCLRLVALIPLQHGSFLTGCSAPCSLSLLCSYQCPKKYLLKLDFIILVLWTFGDKQSFVVGGLSCPWKMLSIIHSLYPTKNQWQPQP